MDGWFGTSSPLDEDHVVGVAWDVLTCVGVRLTSQEIGICATSSTEAVVGRAADLLDVLFEDVACRQAWKEETGSALPRI